MSKEDKEIRKIVDDVANRGEWDCRSVPDRYPRCFYYIDGKWVHGSIIREKLGFCKLNINEETT